jgi:hypothetical protein
LTIEEEKSVVIPSVGIWNKIKNMFQPPEVVKIKRKRINWTGLLMHGALMKGEAIHDIASECMVKFVQMKASQMKRE